MAYDKFKVMKTWNNFQEALEEFLVEHRKPGMGIPKHQYLGLKNNIKAFKETLRQFEEALKYFKY